jgi:hypothetical protein
MSLIKCDLACKHQQEGYCKLDKPMAATGSAHEGCMYFEKYSKIKKTGEFN